MNLDARARHLRGTLLVTAGVLCLVPDSTLVRLVDAPTLTTAAWRGFLIATALFLGLGVRYGSGLGRAFRATGVPGLLSAAMWSATSLLFVASIDRTAVANTLVIISVAPLIAAALTRIVLRRAVPRRTWWAIPLGILGVGITVSGSIGANSASGDLLALALAVVVAANLTLVSARAEVDMVPAAAIGGVITVVVLVAAGAPLAVTADDLVPLALMGGVFVPAALALITSGTRLLPSAEVSLLMLLETALGPIVAWLVVDEGVSGRTFAGGGILVATLVLHSVAGLRAGRRAAVPIIGTGIR